MADELEPIERDDDTDREYIPIPGGYEIQTKGKGSSFRILNRNTDDRRIVSDATLHKFLTQMAHDLRAPWNTRAAPPPEPSEANTYAALLAHWKSLTPLVPDPELELVARAIYEVCLADEPCNNEEWAELRASTDPRQSGLFKHYLDMARAAIAALRAAQQSSTRGESHNKGE